jgi:hypothetical protein
MNNPTTKLRVMVSLATLLCVSSSMADVVHRQFGEHNRMVRVSNDDWQPPGFDTGREIPAVYAADADIAIDGLDTEPEWAAAPDVTVSLAFGNVHEASVKALYTDDDVYIRVRWADRRGSKSKTPCCSVSRRDVNGARLCLPVTGSISMAGTGWRPVPTRSGRPGT